MASFKPVSVKDCPPEDFIKAYAAHLKSNDKIHLPTWVDIVKTGVFKQLSPYDEDWYFVRAAALCRRLYIRPGLGVGHFETTFGGRQRRRGAAPEIHAKAAGGLIRHILRNLESVGLLEQDPKGGRRLTASGQRDMDLIAGRVPVSLPEM
ncbi:hypothetical protein CEUSTIGMA_g11260.t1 [Chlamydomonas eustigma]|uniref:40S ribosomal protein S19 n=1 Tax=Chlamydomonas eustigma TaxID=1157962 RepID=A0A250XLC6_9CHLO|nr:hypothetical protein CEUSTIGMA_g11260.t1 [Chlamydomonas eustigma]|eukprot:GAX83836.1 hypothetical protein CEUSTIGMA_g11260.t1 [Chlamydomonas eustigma]